MAKIGYARVSTVGQNLDAQIDALNAAGCERIFADKASGKLTKRPEFDKALEYLREGDTLVITRLDRLGRSSKHLQELAGQFQERHIELVITTMGIDTSTPMGRMFFTIVAAFAELEHALIQERVREGLEAARAQGRVGGRKPKMTPEKAALAREMLDSGKYTVTAIASALSVSRGTIYNALETQKS